MRKSAMHHGAIYMLFVLPIILLLPILVLLVPKSSYPMTVSGRFNTSFYGWEEVSDSSSSARHVRGYQSAILNLNGVGAANLSLHGYAYGTSDFAERASDDPRLRIHNLYLDWRKIGERVDVRAGRQPIYEGVGIGSIDGGRVAVKLGTRVTAVGYAGILTPLARSNHLNSWSEGNLWGGQLSATSVAGADISLSFTNRERQPGPFTAPPRFNGEMYRENGLDLQKNSRETRLVGLDVRRDLGKSVNLYGRVEVNTLPAGLWEGEVIARYAVPSGFVISGEFSARAPQLPSNDIFSVFDVQQNREVAVRANYPFGALLSASAQIATVLYEGDSAQRLAVGLGIGSGYVGYSRRMGYGGESDGLAANVRTLLHKGLWLRGDMNLSSYRIDPKASDRDGQASGSLAISCQPAEHVTVDIEGQGIRNLLYKDDVRLFLRASYWFFSGARARQGGAW